MKNVHRSTKQHGGIKSGVSQSKTQSSCKWCVLVHCLAGRCKS